MGSVGISAEDIKQYSEDIRSEKDKQTTDRDEEDLDIDDLVASGYSMDEIDQMIDEQEKRRLKKENKKKKKAEVNSECKEDEISEDGGLKEPNIDELIEYGYSMEEIDIMIDEYETEKKRRKKEMEELK